MKFLHHLFSSNKPTGFDKIEVYEDIKDNVLMTLDSEENYNPNYHIQVQRHMSNIESHLIYEAHGKIVAQKMVNSIGQEVSYAGIGRFTNGVDVTEEWTFVNSHTPSGAIQGVGDGMLKTVGNEEIANAKGYGRGLTEVGKVVYRTAQLYSTNSTGRLAFLKDIVGFSDWQVDNSGNYSYKMWQFK